MDRQNGKDEEINIAPYLYFHYCRILRRVYDNLRNLNIHLPEPRPDDLFAFSYNLWALAVITTAISNIASVDADINEDDIVGLVTSRVEALARSPTVKNEGPPNDRQVVPAATISYFQFWTFVGVFVVFILCCCCCHIISRCVNSSRRPSNREVNLPMRPIEYRPPVCQPPVCQPPVCRPPANLPAPLCEPTPPFLPQIPSPNSPLFSLIQFPQRVQVHQAPEYVNTPLSVRAIENPPRTEPNAEYDIINEGEQNGVRHRIPQENPTCSEQRTTPPTQTNDNDDIVSEDEEII